MISRGTAVMSSMIMTAFLGIGGGIYANNDHGDAANRIARDHERQHFYDVLSATESSDDPTVDDHLAVDLISWVKSGKKLVDFRGDENDYAGITDAIGVDPFDEHGLSCQECGPLSPASITLIRQAMASRVVIPIPAEPNQGPFVAPIIGPLAVGGVVTFGFIFYPPYLMRKRRRQHEAELVTAYPIEMAAVRSTENAVRLMPAGKERTDLDEQAHRLRLQLEADLRRSSTKDFSADARDLSRQLREATETMDARKKALEELCRYDH